MLALLLFPTLISLTFALSCDDACSCALNPLSDDDEDDVFCPYDELAVVAGSSFVYKVGVTGGGDTLDDDGQTCLDAVTGEVICSRKSNLGDADDDGLMDGTDVADDIDGDDYADADGDGDDVFVNDVPPFACCSTESYGCLFDGQPCDNSGSAGTCQGSGSSCVDCAFELDTVTLVPSVCGAQVSVTTRPASADPVVEIFKDGVGKVPVVATRGRYFLRVSVNGCEKIFERELEAASGQCDDGRATTNRDTCVDGFCVACPDPVICPGEKSISMTGANGQVVCGTITRRDSGYCAGMFELVWTNSTFGGVALSSYDGCFVSSLSADKTTLTFTFVNDRNNRIEIPVNGVCYARFVQIVSNSKRNALQAPAATTTTLSAIVLLPTVTGSAVGDPHIVGPRGERFEFTGKAGEFYNIFSTPKYFVSARMSLENGVNARFMTRMHVVVGGVDISCDAIDLFKPNDLAHINAQLAPHGAKATLIGHHNGFTLAPQLVVDVCDERIVITALQVTPRQIAALHLVATSVIYNVEFKVAGCHDSFDGVIGQLYKCKYNTNKFVYDEDAVARQFHLHSDNVLPHGYDSELQCLELLEDGAIIGSALLKI